jgi:hypothetical protein
MCILQAVMDRIEDCSDEENKDEEHDDNLVSCKWKVNILVFDIIAFGKERNFLQEGCTAPQRYEILRCLQDPSRGIIDPASSVKVQWAGQLRALMDFDESNRNSLPHIVDCYMRLGWNTPCKIRLIRRADDDNEVDFP